MRTVLVLIALAAALEVGVTTQAPSASGATTIYKQCNGDWIKSVDWIPVANSQWVIHIDPTTKARLVGRFNVNAIWAQLNSCVPTGVRTYPYKDRTASDSAYNQLLCHAALSAGGFGVYSGGATWDLETWRYPYVSIATMMHPPSGSPCNW
jgi:hypothetical protein